MSALQAQSIKLGLGTIEFSARVGRHVLPVPQDEVCHILKLAGEAGIELLDTGAQSGENAQNSEELLGSCLPVGHTFKLITRPPYVNPKIGIHLQPDQLEPALCQSLKNLNQPNLYAVMVSVQDGLFELHGDKVLKRLESLKAQGLFQKVGVSIMDPSQLNSLLQRYRPDIVQIPLNVLDMRFWQSGHLAYLQQKGIEVHARDIFLQGVLLNPTHLHPWFWPIRPLLQKYQNELIQQGFTPLEGALRFAAAVPGVSYALVGVQSVVQLAEMISALEFNDNFDPKSFLPYACEDERWINPLRWNLYE